MNGKSKDTRTTSTHPDDAPELAADFFENATPKVGEQRVDTETYRAAHARKRGRPVQGEPKKAISLRLPESVLERWKATGPGWQTRMVEKLSQ